MLMVSLKILRSVVVVWKEGKRKNFVKCSASYEVDLKKTDSYHQVLDKIAEVIGFEDKSQLVLLTSRGVIITNEKIQILDLEREWTLGGYLNKRHMSPEKLSLGIAKQNLVETQPKRLRLI